MASRATIRRILRWDLKWKPYRPRRVHRLVKGDDRQRYWSCHFFLEKMQADPTFVTNIIWSDECYMKLDGKIVSNNVVHWGPVNPHYTYQKSTNRTGVMVFAAISICGIVGIGFFDEMKANANRKKRNSVNKESYKEMLKEILLPGIAQTYPETEINSLFFMQDGAPSHCVPAFLNLHFENRWIGNAKHEAPIHWPSRSPDITPMGKFTNKLTSYYFLPFLDFSFWGLLRQKVYLRSPTSISDLKQFIKEEADGLPDTYFWKTCNSHVLKRWIECKKSSGRTIENTYAFN